MVAAALSDEHGAPGRDHWGNAMSVLIGGGGVQGGRIVGSTNRLGEVPQDRPLKPGDLHHTLFRVLGVDPHVAYRDRAGRPNPAIDHGEVIGEAVLSHPVFLAFTCPFAQVRSELGLARETIFA
ncbi:MAG: DUF1501 domain-containing protein [Pirellulales bacterium]